MLGKNIPQDGNTWKVKSKNEFLEALKLRLGLNLLDLIGIYKDLDDER